MGVSVCRDIDRESAGGRRLGGADSVKGIAIALVVLTHFAWTDGERIRLLFLFWVDAAVPAFMFVSGLVGAASLERRLGAGELPWQRERITRQLASWLSPLLVVIAVEGAWGGAHGVGWPSVAVAVVLDGRGGPGGYYFSVLAQLAFALPAIYLTMRGRPGPVLVQWLLADVLFEVLSSRWHVGDEAYRMLVGRYLFSVALGCHAWLTRDEKLSPLAGVASMVIGGVFLLATKYAGFMPRLVFSWYATSWAAALWSAPALRWLCLRWGGTRLLSGLGRSSLWVFTSQMVFYRVFSQDLYGAIPSRAAQLAACVAVCLASGVVLDRLHGRWLLVRVHAGVSGIVESARNLITPRRGA